MLDLKANYKGNYKSSNIHCEGCLNKNVVETQEHIFVCNSLSGEIAVCNTSYDDLLGHNVMEQKRVSEILRKRLSKRKEKMDNRTNSPVSGQGPSDPL